MTSGVLLKKRARYGMKAYIAKPMSSASIIAQTMPKRAPFFARPYSAGCDGDFAEGVDIRLHDHVCKADDGVLNAGGKAIADDLPEHFAVDAEFCPMQVVFCRFFRQLYQAQNDADGL